MHIEPGVVNGAKLVLSYGTAVTAFGITGRMALDTVRTGPGVVPLATRSVMATALAFVFFQVLPHHPVGVSEVHFILGSTLFLLFGGGAAAIGLAAGLLLQGLFFAPLDLPQYGMNVTSLLIPLWGISVLAKRIVAPNTPYVDITYRQALALSATYQAGVVGWVAFWAFYGQGFGAENMTAVASFGAAYLVVIAVEPLVDLGVLAAAKATRAVSDTSVFNHRLHNAAA